MLDVRDALTAPAPILRDGVNAGLPGGSRLRDREHHVPDRPLPAHFSSGIHHDGPVPRALFLTEEGGSLEGEILRRGRSAQGHGSAFRNGHGFDLFLEVGDGFDGTKFHDGESDRGLKNTEQHELRSDWCEAELAGFPFVEESLEGAVAQPPGNGLECRIGAHGQGGSFTGIPECSITRIRTGGAAFLQQGGITHLGFLTIPREGVPETLRQGHAEMKDVAGVGSEGIHVAQAGTDWGAVAPRAVP